MNKSQLKHLIKETIEEVYGESDFVGQFLEGLTSDTFFRFVDDLEKENARMNLPSWKNLVEDAKIAASYYHSKTDFVGKFLKFISECPVNSTPPADILKKIIKYADKVLLQYNSKNESLP